jgi:predicted acylesterase/phospholipase RssA
MKPNGNSQGKAGLVLSGGGAFGAYEVGVIQALYGGHSPATSGVPLDAGVFAGTSVGNFNAAVLAMNKGGAAASANRLHDIWINDIADNGDGRGNGVYRLRGDVEHYLNLRIPGTPLEQLKRMLGDLSAFGDYATRSTTRLLSAQGQLLTHLIGMVDLSVFMNVEPFEKLVRNSIEPGVLRESGKALAVTATNWRTGEPWTFRFRTMTDDQTWEAIRASAAIPGLFPPVRMDGEIFIDGGVVMNTPIRPAIDEGATEIHVVSLDPSVPDLGQTYIGTTWDIFNRVFTAMVAANIDEDIESARWVNEGIEILDRVYRGEAFDSADGQRFVRAALMISQKLRADGMVPLKLAIHRYYPKKPLGGVLGLLDFKRPAIDTMIAQGYSDACAHDCRENGCLIPQEKPTPDPG